MPAVVVSKLKMTTLKTLDAFGNNCQRPAVDFTKSKDSSYLELGRVTLHNLELILSYACYSAGLGLVLSPKISIK